MSRRHGKKRPAPSAHAQERAREAPARAAKRVARPATPVVDEAKELRRRKWYAVATSTLLLYMSYVSVLVAFVAAADTDERDVPPGEIAIPLTIGVLLVPVVFAAAAYVSRHPQFLRAVFRALGLFLLAVPATVALQDPVTGMVVGFGAGAVVALRPEPHLGYRSRVWAVLATAVYTALLVRVFPGIGLLAVAALPVAAVALADVFAAKRAVRLQAAGRA